MIINKTKEYFKKISLIKDKSSIDIFFSHILIDTLNHLSMKSLLTILAIVFVSSIASGSIILFISFLALLFAAYSYDKKEKADARNQARVLIERYYNTIEPKYLMLLQNKEIRKSLTSKESSRESVAMSAMIVLHDLTDDEKLLLAKNLFDIIHGINRICEQIEDKSADEETIKNELFAIFKNYEKNHLFRFYQATINIPRESALVLGNATYNVFERWGINV